MWESGSRAMLTVLASSSHMGDRVQKRNTMAASSTAAPASPTQVVGRDHTRPGARSLGTAGSGRSGGASTERLVTARQGSHRRPGPDATGLRTALLRSGGLRWRVVAG